MAVRRKRKLPVEPVRAHVAALSHDGRGVAQLDGKTVFIDGALPGEDVMFVYRARRGRFDEGRTVEVLTASPQRATPRCPHFGVCGGCSLQHMAPEAQIEAKQAVLLEQLEHIGRVRPKDIFEPLHGELWGYRRKARLGVKYVAKKQRLFDLSSPPDRTKGPRHTDDATVDTPTTKNDQPPVEIRCRGRFRFDFLRCRENMRMRPHESESLQRRRGAASAARSSSASAPRPPPS